MNAIVEFRYRCFLSSAPLDDNKGLILPPQALEKLLSEKVAFPLTFAISVPTSKNNSTKMDIDDEEEKAEDNNNITNNNEANKQVNVWFSGVSEFSAPEQTIFAPKSLFEGLKIKEGTMVELHNVNLEKGTFAQLTTLDPAWLKIPVIERQGLLEFALRKYQFLFEGQNITIEHNRIYRFQVTQTKPTHVISIIDTDLQTDVISPPQTVKASEHENSRTYVMAIGEETTTEMKNKDEYYNYQTTIEDPHQITSIEARPLNGDVDLYVSCVGDLFHDALPTVQSFTWSSQERGNTIERIILSQQDPNFKPGKYDIAVRSYGGPAKFTLSIKEVTSQDEKKGHTLNQSVKSETEENDPTASICPNCLKRIPKQALLLHETRCRKINYLCKECDPPILLSTVQGEKEKHQDIYHTPLFCAYNCGIKLPQKQLQEHRLNQCQNRVVGCIYCPLTLTVALRGVHQAECGLRSATCKQCAINFKRKEIFRHISQSHNVPRGELTWKDYY